MNLRFKLIYLNLQKVSNKPNPNNFSNDFNQLQIFNRRETALENAIDWCEYIPNDPAVNL